LGIDGFVVVVIEVYLSLLNKTQFYFLDCKYKVLNVFLFLLDLIGQKCCQKSRDEEQRMCLSGMAGVLQLKQDDWSRQVQACSPCRRVQPKHGPCSSSSDT